MRLGALTDPEPTDSIEQPRATRRPVKLAGYASLEDGSTFSIQILDLSHDGCKIETAVALLPAVSLTVTAVGLGTLPARVRWYADGRAGLRFLADEVAPPAEASRKEERLVLSWTLHLRRAGRQSYKTRAFDLSPSGCKVEFVERPIIDEQVWIKLDGLNGLAADVRWIESFYAGLEFRHSIHPAVFDLLIARI